MGWFCLNERLMGGGGQEAQPWGRCSGDRGFLPFCWLRLCIGATDDEFLQSKDAWVPSHIQLWDPMDCSPPGSPVHGISQPRALEWVAISSSRVSSQSRDQTYISCIGRQVLYHWDTWEVLQSKDGWLFITPLPNCLFGHHLRDQHPLPVPDD